MQTKENLSQTVKDVKVEIILSQNPLLIFGEGYF